MDTGDRLEVLLVNNSDDAVTINHLLRFNGFDSELTLIVDGKPASFARIPGLGHVSPQDVSDPDFILEPGRIMGTSLRDMDMESLYGVKKGQCVFVQVVYQNKMPVPEISPLQLKSNSIRYCH